MLDCPEFVVAFQKIPFGTRSHRLRFIEGNVAFVKFHGKLGDFRTISGVMGKTFKVTKVTHDYHGMGIVILKKPKHYRPRFPVMPWNVGVRYDKDLNYFLTGSNFKMPTRINLLSKGRVLQPERTIRWSKVFWFLAYLFLLFATLWNLRLILLKDVG